MATEMKRKTGDSDERGRESSTRRRKQPRRRDGDVCRGTTTKMATEMTTTEETENDGDSDERGRRALRRSRGGDVTRRVAERGGYAVSSGCTTGAGTGSSKQTTKTSREETFCRVPLRKWPPMTTTEETENDGDSDERGT
ncbi:hypothetical protein GN244_ATG20330 [Phytophthora infestans]|uniref:Uncharacterized protein n=1 Tax=Phytophthora infestans TaxID=4787 RepID=A0A833W480_PHYIN|nr:hypothetical protein GN244_ATG20330 [Phytophthora infestans]